MAQMEIDLTEVIFALSDALDLVALDRQHHGKHVAYISVECGRHLGWGENTLHDLLFAAMMHDCGISSTNNYRAISQEENPLLIQEHCQRGHQLLLEFEPFSPLASLVLYHHTPWMELCANLVPRKVALLANCINLASHVNETVNSLPQNYLLAYTEEIRAHLRGLKGTAFAPQLVDAFLEVSDRESFWLLREPQYLNPRLWRLAQNKTQPIDLEILKQLARIFARIVDGKSPFTAEHSQGVSQLAGYLGQLTDLPRKQVLLLEIAGYLHDIGKLRVPDEILNKPGKLDEREVAVIRRHSFDTYQILNSIRGLWDVAEMAAFHHETVNGSGYPFRLDAPLLSLEARIVAVSDVFQALAQRRPYRKDMDPARILEILQQMAADGKLDRKLVDIVAENLDECWLVATLQRETQLGGAP